MQKGDGQAGAAKRVGLLLPGAENDKEDDTDRCVFVWCAFHKRTSSSDNIVSCSALLDVPTTEEQAQIVPAALSNLTEDKQQFSDQMYFMCEQIFKLHRSFMIGLLHSQSYQR